MSDLFSFQFLFLCSKSSLVLCTFHIPSPHGAESRIYRTYGLHSTVAFSLINAFYFPVEKRCCVKDVPHGAEEKSKVRPQKGQAENI